jgi:peptidyl-prolyl cis-trans isomerase B (cyclophilin B)
MAIIAGAVAVVVVIAGVSYISLRNNDDGTTPAAQPTDTATTAGPASDCEYRASGDASKPVDPPPNGKPSVSGKYTATVTTNVGTVTLELDADQAPCTVQSFMHLADAGYFDDTPCHRLTTSATLKVLQCGDPSGSGSGGPGYEFDDEVTPDLTYGKGTVAMANAGPNTNGSQFFLVYAKSKLPPNYTVFGKIAGGLDVLTTLAEAGVAGGGSDGAPATAVTIESITIVPGVVSTDTPTETTSPSGTASTEPSGTDSASPSGTSP